MCLRGFRKEKQKGIFRKKVLFNKLGRRKEKEINAIGLKPTEDYGD